ncbi:MAG: hypothetical protein QOD53_2031, partial [Thermoleophilaceae bacterium]|nr:hypothetical protein [Thermoleophilaceae bacterium]
MVAGTLPAGAAAAKHRKPVIGLRGVATSQKQILKRGRITVRVSTRRAKSRVRVFASVRVAGKHATPIVATKIRELKVRRRHSRKVSLKLSRAGRNALLGCAKRKIVVTAAPIVRAAGKPGHRTRRTRMLKRDRCGHGGSGGGSGGSKKGAGRAQPSNYMAPADSDR